MDLISAVGALGEGFVGYALPFLFVLTIVVFFHEFGHFWVARLCGVRVEAFSIGFGPELAGFNDRHGTRWRLGAIPLGGYVRFFGDENAASVPDGEAVRTMTEAERRVSFHYKPVWQRAAVVVAGPLANFVLAIAIFAGIYTLYGKQITAARVDVVEPGSAADTAGFKAGDVVVTINGQPIRSFSDMQRVVGVNADTEIAVEVDRGGVRQHLLATPRMREIKDNFGNTIRTGILGLSRSTTPEEVIRERHDPFTSTWMAVQETWYVTERTLAYVGGLIAGKESADQLGGPIRIAQLSGQVAGVGMIALVNLAAILSISIGLLNLFPIPMLDGGHLVFYAVEAARGRPIGERAQEMFFRVGLALVLMLMLFATWNDIVHLATS
ncbi:RIP metalloprotease RseP [Blastochloris viridis]|uniref:Zinc metalloprotease n=1 Tax=Blastochloris viridis TaxID=1079 RepID=A0A0H5BHI6_BLAVI|nr:RIP metalloprotease RseP [Blastochloris viridis]ALK10197.1 Metalloprotease MmpA [Blastochloris viridis]BAR99871.1 membrane-associated zinc metalloprotease [Blastochloris viridis]CUU42861.1 Metalloprotease mmpA [Blastochloris viridis]